MAISNRYALSPAESAVRRFAPLDSMRGVAALAVVFYHLYGVLAHDGTTAVFGSALDWLCRQGRLGVPAFFVLSGFVITHAVRPLKLSRAVFTTFVLRRSVRLDPTYWVVLFATFAVNGLLANSGVIHRPAVSAGVVVANMFYLQEIVSAYSPVNVAWTLCAEIQFYLFFITLVWTFQWLSQRIPRRMARLVVFAPPAIASLLLAAGHGPHLRGIYLDHWYLFFLGTMAYWCLMGLLSSAWFWIYTGLMLLVCREGVLSGGNIVGGVLAGLAIHGLARFGLLQSQPRGRVLAYLGSRSYSMYIVHVLVGSNVARLLLRLNYFTETRFVLTAIFLVALAAGIAAAEVLFRTVERPTHRLARRISFQPMRRRETTAAPLFTPGRSRACNDELAV